MGDIRENEMSDEVTKNAVLTEAQRVLGNLVVSVQEGRSIQLPEEQALEAGRDFLLSSHKGEVPEGMTEQDFNDIHDMKEGVITFAADSVGLTPAEYEALGGFEGLGNDFDNLRFSQQTLAPQENLPESEPDIAQAIPEQQPDTNNASLVERNVYTHDDVTNNLLDSVAETLGGEEYGHTRESVAQQLEEYENMPEGQFKESFEGAVVEAFATTDGARGTYQSLEQRATISGYGIREEALESSATNTLKGMVDNMETSPSAAAALEQEQAADMTMTQPTQQSGLSL